MKQLHLLLTFCFSLGLSISYSQCTSETAAHLNINDMPATLSNGITVSASGTYINSTSAIFASCGETESFSFGIYTGDFVTFTFSQPVYNVSFAMAAFNMNESISVSSNGSGQTLSTNCADMTISGNSFIRTSGAEWYNNPVLHLDYTVGATSITITGTSPGNEATALDLLDCVNCLQTSNSIVVNSCGDYTAPSGQLLTSNGIYTDITSNAAGCDSVITIDLTIQNTSTGTDTQLACETYTWMDGNTYTATTNTPTWTLTNAAGCDSVVTLDLTINYSNSGTDTQLACETYTWMDGNTYTATTNTPTWTLTNAAGCDSVVTLDLTINYSNSGTDTQLACDTYTWMDGNTYNASTNTPTWTLTNAAGCDSVVTLDLTINSVSDITTTVNGITISANNSNATYVWLDCDDNFSIIAGETNQSYTPLENSNYAVELSENGCTDTSACEAITTIGIIENSFIEEFSLYPNPTNGIFYIEFNSSQETIELKIMDASGKMIEDKTFNQVDLIEYELIQPKGIYLIEVSDKKNQRSIIRLIKQ
jgi:hypothetical protein